MSKLSMRILKWTARTTARIAGGVLLLLLLSHSVSAQSWSWTYELIDTTAIFPSIAVDANSNLHVSYGDSAGGLSYAFRPAGSAHWFKMALDKQLGQLTTHIAVDGNNNPHICYTPGMMKYAHWDGKAWQIQQIAKDSGVISFTCSITISKDGMPHVSWYHMSGVVTLNIRYAELKDNAWQVRTLDFDRETGKWNAMVLDNHDNPLLTYSAWIDGELRLARWDGKQWGLTTVDSRTRSHDYNVGQGNALVLGPDGKAHISFYTEKVLKYARQVDDGWKIETVDQVPWDRSWASVRSSIVLDRQGFPHICYENEGLLKHAYWDGKQWRRETIATSGGEAFRYSSMVIGRDDTLYVVFRDADDNSLKLATGRLVKPQPSVTSENLKPETPSKPE